MPKEFYSQTGSGRAKRAPLLVMSIDSASFSCSSHGSMHSFLCNPQHCSVSYQCRGLHFRYHEGLSVDSNMVNKLGHNIIPSLVQELFGHSIVNIGDLSHYISIKIPPSLIGEQMSLLPRLKTLQMCSTLPVEEHLWVYFFPCARNPI